MKKNLIPQQEIKRGHPRGLVSYTDGDYANFASLLLEAINNAYVRDLTSLELKLITVNLTLYYEDVMADAGVWRGFTNKMHEMYGKYLPFYSINDKEYLQDEPSLEDVKFVVWNTLVNTRSLQGRIVNPETPAVESIAEAAYRLMDEWFEEIPINEELKAYFEKADFMDDYYLQRDVLKWLTYDCYLTYVPDAEDLINSDAEHYAEILNDDHAGAYVSESQIPYTHRIGPLALIAQQWLSLILVAHGNEEKAQWAANQEYVMFEILKVIESDANKGMKLETPKGMQFFITCEGLNNPGSNFYDSKTVIGSFVKYNGEWNANADHAASQSGLDIFEQLQDHARSMKQPEMKQYDELLKKSKGNPFFYFESLPALRAFMKEYLKIPEEMASKLDAPGTEKDIVLTVFGKDKPVGLIRGGAKCLKDERNPYYDKEYAKKHAFEIALNMPREFLEYAMEHDMLPDAALNSIRGEERGRKLVHENYDFLARSLMRDGYQEVSEN